MIQGGFRRSIGQDSDSNYIPALKRFGKAGNICLEGDVGAFRAELVAAQNTDP